MKKSTILPPIILGIIFIGISIYLHSHTPSQAILSKYQHQPFDLQNLLLNPCLQSITAILSGISLFAINAISKSQPSKALNSNSEIKNHAKKISNGKILLPLSIMLLIYGFSVLLLHWNYIKDNAESLISVLIYHAYNASSSHLDYYTWKRTITGAKEMIGIMSLAIIAPILFLLTLLRTQLDVKKTL